MLPAHPDLSLEKIMRSLITVAALAVLSACSDRSHEPMYFDCSMKWGPRHLMELNLSDKTANLDWGFYAKRLAGNVHSYDVTEISDEQVTIATSRGSADEYKERRISRIDGRFVVSVEGEPNTLSGVCTQIDNPYGERSF